MHATVVSCVRFGSLQTPIPTLNYWNMIYTKPPYSDIWLVCIQVGNQEEKYYVERKIPYVTGDDIIVTEVRKYRGGRLTTVEYH